jgi:ABC-type phosphate/phosphonate transport system, ATPase component
MKQIQMTKIPPFSLISTNKIIQMNDVWTSYDSKSFVLQGVNLSIDRGTNYAIVGQSGSGKSTLLKLMNGMMIPSKGTIKIDYQTPNMNNKKFKKMMHTIGYIPQSLGLVKNISVIDNILIGALPRLNAIQSLLKQFPEHEIQEAKKDFKN